MSKGFTDINAIVAEVSNGRVETATITIGTHEATFNVNESNIMLLLTGLAFVIEEGKP